MPSLQFVASLSPPHTLRCSAFCTSFGINDTQTKSECSVTEGVDNHLTGCSVSRMDISIHSSAPHLESVAHVIGLDCFPYFLSDIFPQGTMEECILITPKIIRLDHSGECYPLGSPADPVISMKELVSSMQGLVSGPHLNSVLVRVDDSHLPRILGTAEIRDWPYLTLQAAEFLERHFVHYRTNAPSVERCASQGGMWSHCSFFGVNLHRPKQIINRIDRTIGELFYIPGNLSDGCYTMVCPYFDVGLDCAITSPLLFKANMNIHT